MALSDSGRSRPAAAGASGGRLQPIAIALVAVVAGTLSIMLGWRNVAVDGLLAQTDAYERLSRLVASFEAGRVLDHIPRDNGGTYLVLHWSHLLDALIVVLALPLMPFLGLPRALHYGGAAIGPVTLFLAGLAVVLAVRQIAGAVRQPVLIGVLGIVGPSVLAYGIFGQTDHHVLLGALAVLAPALAFGSGDPGSRPRLAAYGGLAGGLGIWTSPELVPFVLFGWAVAILRDVEVDGRMARRGAAYALALLACLAVGFAIDPPAPDRFAVEADRLSRPFVELALLMSVAAVAGRRFAPALAGTWPPAFVAGAIAAAAVVPWLIVYPAVLRGPAGIFSAEAQLRVWNHITEMASPTDLHSMAGFALFPTVALVLACGALLWRRFGPMALLVAAMAAIVALFAWRHVRFCVYLNLAAAVAVGVFLERAQAASVSSRSRVVALAAGLVFAVLPLACIALLPKKEPERARGTCSMIRAAPGLAPMAGKVVLTALNYAPQLVYFTPAVAMTGPYHRGERRILALLDAYDERAFADAVPRTFAATGAQAVMVCTSDGYRPGTLGAALAAGNVPPWLVERPLPPDSHFRLFELK